MSTFKALNSELNEYSHLELIIIFIVKSLHIAFKYTFKSSSQLQIYIIFLK